MITDTPPGGQTPLRDFDVPPAPAWKGDPVPYGSALDSWLAQLRPRCDDPAWVAWYMRMHGQPASPETPLPPYPERGDSEGWARWWAEWRKSFRAVGASADGISDNPDPKLQPLSVSAVRVRRKRRRFKALIANVVRQVMAEELPEAIAYLAGRES